MIVKPFAFAWTSFLVFNQNPRYKDFREKESHNQVILANNLSK